MKQKQEKLETKMKWMLLSTMIPMTILIIVLLVFFWHYTNEYNQLSNNLAVSSEYNANYRNSNNDMSFKDEVDMDIYYVTIGRKGKDGLPTEQVDKAISTVESLKKTTSKKESLRSLKYLTNYLENLKKRMNQLLEIKNYQEGHPQLLHVETMEEAVQTADQITKPGDIVTLSPACASFDKYPNFEERGLHYKRLVKELSE